MKDLQECFSRRRLSAISLLLLLVYDCVAFTTTHSRQQQQQQQYPRNRLQWTNTECRSRFMTWRPSSRLHVSEGTETTITTNTSSAVAESTAAAATDEEEKTNNILKGLVSQAFSLKAEILTFALVEHSPLGCTVEESLNDDDDYVFISKITPGGHAEKIGLKVGDVIVGVTGLFGGITSVMDAGVEPM
jgi:hypothetical protein